MPLPDALSSVTVKTPSPDGTIYLTISELEDGTPAQVHIMIGKAGSPVMAWAYCVARLISVLLEKGVPLSRIIEETSGVTTDKIMRYGDGVVIRSGSEGISHALMKYMDATKGNGK